MNKKILFTVCATATLASAAANIDDFEDGNGLASTGADDAWYAFNDENDGGASTYSNTTDTYGLVVVIPDAAAGGSKYGAGLTDIELVQGTNEYDPYVTLGLNIADGLSGCTTISYKYKGAGHNLKAVMKGDETGTLTQYNRHSKALTSSTSWSTATVAVSGLAQDKGWGKTVTLNMANVVQLAWEVKGTASPNYLYIDDVNCTGYAGGGGSSSNPGGGDNPPPKTGSTSVIDDFEDNNTTAENLGKEAYWYLYKAGGSFTNTQDANETWDILVKETGNSYVEMKGISGITPGDTTYPSVGMEVAFDASVLSGCTAVQYDYKGSGHHLRASVTGVKADNGFEHVAPDQNASTGWKTVTVSTMEQPDWVAAANLVAFSWAKVSKLTWVVDEKVSAANLGTSLAVDNVKCVGTLPTAPKNSAIHASVAPASFKAALHGNTLQMTVAKAGLVKIQVLDMMGHAIERHSENMAAGSFAHDFAKLNKGAYIVRVQQGSMVKTVRMQVR